MTWITITDFQTFRMQDLGRMQARYLCTNRCMNIFTTQFSGGKLTGGNIYISYPGAIINDEKADQVIIRITG